MGAKAEHDVDEFKRLVAEGWSREELAVRYDVHPGTISAWKSQNGLARKRKRKYNDKETRLYYDKAIAECYKPGISNKDIIKEVGCDECTVVAWRRRHGKPLYKQEIAMLKRAAKNESLRKIDYSRVQELYDAGKIDSEIASEVGCLKKTIGNWRREHGLPFNKTCTQAQNLTVNLASLLGIPERKSRPKPEIKVIARKPKVTDKEEIVSKDAVQKLNDNMQKLNSSLQMLNNNLLKLTYNLQKGDAHKPKSRSKKKTEPDTEYQGCPNFDLERWQWCKNTREAAKSIEVR